MSIITKSTDLKKLFKAGHILALILLEARKTIKIGDNLLDIDQFIEKQIIKNKCRPSFKGFEGYPSASCLSVNSEVVHAVPKKYYLQDGDILSIDVGLWLDNVCVDAAITLGLGSINISQKLLISSTKKALKEVIKIIKPGIHTGDIGNTIQSIAEINNLRVIKNLTGHGVGYKVHDHPSIPNYGLKGQGILIIKNMVLAIEPMFTMGKSDTITSNNGWNIMTADNSQAAQFEHTVIVTKSGCKVITEV